VKHNPFSTRNTIPGSIPYYFGGDFFSCRLDDNPIFLDTVSSFKKYDYQSQIVGGHGTGKTTFLIEFVQYLERYDHTINHITLHDGQPALPDEFWERQISLVSQFKKGNLEKSPITVIDGYEQLSLTQKIWLRRSCRKGKSGLLITTHVPAWRLPVLLHTEPTYMTLQYIIGHLFHDQPDIEPPEENLCRSVFERHRGNLRETLFELYDHYEA